MRARGLRGGVALALVAAWLTSGCGSVTYVEGPPALGPYVGSGASGPTAVEEGRLDAKDGVVERGSYGDTYAFFGRAGEQVGVSLASGQIDCYLLVVDAAGRVLAEDDDSGGDLDSRLSVVLPEDGLYLVVATSYSRESGDYELRVDRPGGAASYPLLAFPVDLQRRFTSPGPEDGSGNPYHVYALDVRAGSELSAWLTSGQADTLLRLYDASGQEVASDDDSAGSLNALLRFTPPDAGRYFLVATTYSRPAPFGGASYHLVVTQ